MNTSLQGYEPWILFVYNGTTSMAEPLSRIWPSQKPTNLQSTVSGRIKDVEGVQRTPVGQSYGRQGKQDGEIQISFQTSTILVYFVSIVLSGLALPTYHAVTCGVTITPRQTALFTHSLSSDAHKSHAYGSERDDEPEPDCWTFCLINPHPVGIRRRSRRGRYAQVDVSICQQYPSIRI
jgi:hypothetical protein